MFIYPKKSVNAEKFKFFLTFDKLRTGPVKISNTPEKNYYLAFGGVVASSKD